MSCSWIAISQGKAGLDEQVLRRQLDVTCESMTVEVQSNVLVGQGKCL